MRKIAKFNEYSLKHKKATLLRHQKRQIKGVSTNDLLDVWKTLLSYSKYFLSNSLSQTIKYCCVALVQYIKHAVVS